jgi:hypothetical protein
MVNLCPGLDREIKAKITACWSAEGRKYWQCAVCRYMSWKTCDIRKYVEWKHVERKHLELQLACFFCPARLSCRYERRKRVREQHPEQYR